MTDAPDSTAYSDEVPPEDKTGPNSDEREEPEGDGLDLGAFENAAVSFFNDAAKNYKHEDKDPAPGAYIELCLVVEDLIRQRLHRMTPGKISTDPIKNRLSSWTLDELSGKGSVTKCKKSKATLSVEGGRYKTDYGWDWEDLVWYTGQPTRKAYDFLFYETSTSEDQVSELIPGYAEAIVAFFSDGLIKPIQDLYNQQYQSSKTKSESDKDKSSNKKPDSYSKVKIEAEANKKAEPKPTQAQGKPGPRVHICMDVHTGTPTHTGRVRVPPVGEGEGRGEGIHKREVGIGYGITGFDVEQSGVKSASVDAEGQSQSMHENHVGGDKDVDKGTESSNEDSDQGWKGPHSIGYIREKVPVPKAVLNVLEEELSRFDLGEYAGVVQRVIAHVYYCQTRKPYQYSDGVPIYYELIQYICKEDEEASIPSKTADVWEPVEGDLLEVSKYIYREGDVGRSREFSLTERLLSRLDASLQDSYEYKTRYNLVDGSKTRSRFQTELTYDGEHSWEEKSTFIHKTLKRLKGQRDLVNREAVEAHLDRLEEELSEAEQKYEEADRAVKQLENEILEEGKSLTEEEKERLREAREPAYKAGRELERVRSRYRQDTRIWSDIIAQGLENAEGQPEGIYQYETAYEVQLKSGRLTQTCGLQNASSEMKAAAAKGIPDLKDMDIKSSQTEALIQEMQMAVRMGAALDVSILIHYIDEGGKDSLAEQFGIDRENWKRPEHSVKFGAGFNHDTFEAARGAAEGKVMARITDEEGEPDFSQLHQFDHESGKSAYERAVYNELPTMAQVARDWADEEDIGYDDPETVYSILQGAYEEMAEEIDSWRDWLVDEYWTEQGRHGSGFGYYVSNPCSIPFSKYDANLAESGDEPDRYNKKTGFATSRLQGLEAAYMHALVLIQDDFDYEVLRNEHDGAVILGEIPDEAQDMARLISGFHRAKLKNKPFEHDDTEEHNDTNNTDSNSEENPCESKSNTSTTNENTGSPNTTTESRSGENDRTPSGSGPKKPTSSNSGTGFASPAETSSSKNSPTEKRNGSNGSSGATTGTTSPETTSPEDREPHSDREPRRRENGPELPPELQEPSQEKLERRVEEGDVPPNPQLALKEGFSIGQFAQVHPDVL